MIPDKYVGLGLAIVSTLAIGTSFVITKKGLNQAAQQHGFSGEGFSYLKSPMWWSGILTMVVGEIANFAAYAFAPAILVTPLGALSVLIGAVLGSYFLGERLGILGRLGCAICLVGSVVIVLHAPPDEDIETIDEILHFALQRGFLSYIAIVSIFAVVMIYRIAPLYGKKNPLIYLSICSTVGSVSIMAIKGFGIAVKLTVNGKNQFTHPSTYVFVIVVVVCILTQMNYFNKALSQFSTNIVNPLYYVTFTTFTLTASFILYGGFNTTDTVNTISLLAGFLTIFAGVYLLNLSRDDPDGHNLGIRQGDGSGVYHEVDGIPTDGFSGLGTRVSMQARRSVDSRRHSRTNSWNFRDGLGARKEEDRDHLIYDLESNGGLRDLAEDSEEDSSSGKKRRSFDNANGHANGHANGNANGPGSSTPRRSNTVHSETVRAGGKSFDRIR